MSTTVIGTTEPPNPGQFDPASICSKTAWSTVLVTVVTMMSVDVVVAVVVGDTVSVTSMVVVAVAAVVVMVWVVATTISEQAFEIKERANVAKSTSK